MGNRESWRDPHPLAAYRWLGIWQAIMACINQLITRFRLSQFAAPRKLSENALVAGKCHRRRQRRRRRRNESKTNRRIKLPNCGRECSAYPDIEDPRLGRVIMSHACPIFCRLSSQTQPFVIELMSQVPEQVPDWCGYYIWCVYMYIEERDDLSRHLIARLQ